MADITEKDLLLQAARLKCLDQEEEMKKLVQMKKKTEIERIKIIQAM
jgi:hypothetical protein